MLNMVPNQATKQAKYAIKVQALKASQRGNGLHLTQPYMACIGQPKTEF